MKHNCLCIVENFRYQQRKTFNSKLKKSEVECKNQTSLQIIRVIQLNVGLIKPKYQILVAKIKSLMHKVKVLVFFFFPSSTEAKEAETPGGGGSWLRGQVGYLPS
jgi:hypothetical protein